MYDLPFLSPALSIRAIEGGEVVAVSHAGGVAGYHPSNEDFGGTVVVKGNFGLTTRYHNMSSTRRWVEGVSSIDPATGNWLHPGQLEVGDTVQQGDWIGSAGPRNPGEPSYFCIEVCHTDRLETDPFVWDGDQDDDFLNTHYIDPVSLFPSDGE